MNIIHISYSDVVGRRFNGYDLSESLNAIGHHSSLYVWEKSSKECWVKQYNDSKFRYISSVFNRILEDYLSLQSVFAPLNILFFIFSPEFRSADVIHLHIVYPYYFNIFSLLIISILKPVVWTWHDMWPFTGHCVHAFACSKWKSQCDNCPSIDSLYPIHNDRTKIMFYIKKFIYKFAKFKIIVASQWMQDNIIKSPLARNHSVNIIPFGIDLKTFSPKNKVNSRKKLGIPENNFVIGLRANSSEFKGILSIQKLLHRLDIPNVSLVLFDKRGLFDEWRAKYQIVDVGWVNDSNTMSQHYSSCDLFISLSDAESFGMMAIEAMSCGLPVIAFNNTALADIIHPEMKSGIVIKKNDIKGLVKTIHFLRAHPETRREMSHSARRVACKYYDFNRYLNDHLLLYKSLIKT